MEKYSPNTSADNAKEDGRKIKENYSRKKKEPKGLKRSLSPILSQYFIRRENYIFKWLYNLCDDCFLNDYTIC